MTKSETVQVTRSMTPPSASELLEFERWHEALQVLMGIGTGCEVREDEIIVYRNYTKVSCSTASEVRAAVSAILGKHKERLARQVQAYRDVIATVDELQVLGTSERHGGDQ